MRRDCTNVQSGCTIRDHETFNLFNTFRWGLPSTILEGATFGRITSMAGAPRIMQFGIKYEC